MYMAGGWHPEDPTPHATFEHLPWGFADKVHRRGTPWDFRRWLADSEAALPRLTLPPARNYTDDRWESVAVKDYYQAGRPATPSCMRRCRTQQYHKARRDAAAAYSTPHLPACTQVHICMHRQRQ